MSIFVSRELLVWGLWCCPVFGLAHCIGTQTSPGCQVNDSFKLLAPRSDTATATASAAATSYKLQLQLQIQIHL